MSVYIYMYEDKWIRHITLVQMLLVHRLPVAYQLT